MIPLAALVVGLAGVALAAYVASGVDLSEQVPEVVAEKGTLTAGAPALSTVTAGATSSGATTLVIDGKVITCDTIQDYIDTMLESGEPPSEEVFWATMCFADACSFAEAESYGRELVTLYAPAWLGVYDVAASLQAFIDENHGECA